MINMSIPRSRYSLLDRREAEYDPGGKAFQEDQTANKGSSMLPLLTLGYQMYAGHKAGEESAEQLAYERAQREKEQKIGLSQWSQQFALNKAQQGLGGMNYLAGQREGANLAARRRMLRDSILYS
jgi:hypothetical protein